MDEQGVPITADRFRRAETFAGGIGVVTTAGGHDAYYRADGSTIWRHAKFEQDLSPALV